MKPTFIEPILCTQRQAAKILALSERTLYTLRKMGKLPFVSVGAGHSAIRYALADLEAFIAANRNSAK